MNARARGLAAVVLWCAAAVGSLPAVRVSAAPLRPGDVLVVNGFVPYRVDPATGQRSQFADEGGGHQIELDRDGTVLMLDADNKVVHRYDRAGGLLSSLPLRLAGGQPLAGSTYSFAVEPSGSFLLSRNSVTFPDTGGYGVYRADPRTGVASLLSPTPLGSLAVAPDGGIVGVEFEPLVEGKARRIVRIDPTSGAPSAVASSFDVEGSGALALAADGGILVTNYLWDDIRRFDPETGAMTTVSRGGLFFSLNGTLSGLAVEPGGGDILVSYAPTLGGPTGYVFRIDPATGAQSVLAAVPFPTDLAVVPIPEPAAAALAMTFAALLLTRRGRRRRHTAR